MRDRKKRLRTLERLYEAAQVEVKDCMLKNILVSDEKNRIQCDSGYQRNYIWDCVKASNLVETVLLKAIIPPIVVMEDEGKIIMIDGKQRYESLLHFYNNQFKLKERGLSKLKPLLNLKYDSLPRNTREIFEEYKIKMLCYKITNPSFSKEEKELLRRDLYRRYNQGKTPLKEHEIARAKYMYDELTQVFMKYFEENPDFYHECIEILLPKTRRVLESNREKISLLMVTIRELLIIPYVSIVGEKTIQIGMSMVDLYYDVFFKNLSQQDIKEKREEFEKILGKLKLIKEKLERDNHELQDNVMFFKNVYWLLAILYKVSSDKFYKFNVDRLCHYVEDGGEVYFESYNNFTRDHVRNRYEYLANYIENELKVNLAHYITEVKDNKLQIRYVPDQTIDRNEDWNGIQANRQLLCNKEEMHINEMIDNIKKNRFIIQPEYQRAEVRNKIKASKIIESIILGVKLPPIYLYTEIPERGLFRDFVLDRTTKNYKYFGIYGGNDYK